MSGQIVEYLFDYFQLSWLIGVICLFGFDQMGGMQLHHPLQTGIGGRRSKRLDKPMGVIVEKVLSEEK